MSLKLQSIHYFAQNIRFEQKTKINDTNELLTNRRRHVHSGRLSTHCDARRKVTQKTPQPFSLTPGTKNRKTNWWKTRWRNTKVLFFVVFFFEKMIFDGFFCCFLKFLMEKNDLWWFLIEKCDVLMVLMVVMVVVWYEMWFNMILCSPWTFAAIMVMEGVGHVILFDFVGWHWPVRGSDDVNCVRNIVFCCFSEISFSYISCVTVCLNFSFFLY